MNAQRTSGRWWIAVISVLLIVTAVIAGGIWWSVSRKRTSAVPTSASFASYESAWTSAMHKAGVKAAFPGGPVDVSAVQAEGKHPFSATFSPKEIAALLAVYQYKKQSIGDFEIENISVSFPATGVGQLEGTVLVGGSRYQAQAKGPVNYLSRSIVINRSQTELSIEGFSVGGKQREQALDQVMAYFNGLVDAAPGLTLTQARIVPGGVVVRGVAPDNLVHPSVLPTGGAAAWGTRGGEAGSGRCIAALEVPKAAFASAR